MVSTFDVFVWTIFILIVLFFILAEQFDATDKKIHKLEDEIRRIKEKLEPEKPSY